MKRDIQDLDDIRRFVNNFYDEVRRDELIGPVFDERIADRWPVHLEKMYRFWQTVLLEEHTYSGSPFMPHLTLAIEAPHFERWLKICFRVVDELFEGEKANELKWRAEKMARMFDAKLSYYRSNPSLQPL